MTEVDDIDYKKYYNKECNSLDARTFSNVLATVKGFLKSEKCPPKMRVKFADFLFRKIYMYFSPMNDVLEELCNPLKPTIDELKEIVTKGMYLHFNNVDAITIIALHFYFTRFTGEEEFFVLQMLNDTQLVKNYLQKYGVTKTELRDHFVKWIQQTPIFEQKSNLLDVLLKYYPNDREVQGIYDDMRYGDKKEKSVYSDDQNVHDEDIKLSVLDVAEKLIKWSDEQERERPGPIKNDGVPFRVIATRLLDSFARSPEEKEIVQCVIERMCIDTTDFHSKEYTFRISDVFLALMNYIHRSPLKENFYQPLKEELEIMCKLCSSGYVARFVNILRGFDDRFEVTISFEKHLYARLAHKLHLAMEKASDEVIEGSYDDEYKEVYLAFVREVVNKEMPYVVKDYGIDDVKMEVIAVMNRLTSFDKWRIKEVGGSLRVEY